MINHYQRAFNINSHDYHLLSIASRHQPLTNPSETIINRRVPGISISLISTHSLPLIFITQYQDPSSIIIPKCSRLTSIDIDHYNQQPPLILIIMNQKWYIVKIAPDNLSHQTLDDHVQQAAHRLRCSTQVQPLHLFRAAGSTGQPPVPLVGDNEGAPTGDQNRPGRWIQQWLVELWKMMRLRGYKGQLWVTWVISGVVIMGNLSDFRGYKR